MEPCSRRNMLQRPELLSPAWSVRVQASCLIRHDNLVDLGALVMAQHRSSIRHTLVKACDGHVSSLCGG